MDNVFPNAIEARTGARNNTIIYGEIRLIEAAVLTAIDSGLLGVDVNNTTMTTPGSTAQSYAAVWQATLTDRSKFEQMMIVEKYFRDLGYSIRRKLPSSNSLTFVWEVLW